MKTKDLDIKILQITKKKGGGTFGVLSSIDTGGLRDARGAPAASVFPI